MPSAIFYQHPFIHRQIQISSFPFGFNKLSQKDRVTWSIKSLAFNRGHISRQDTANEQKSGWIRRILRKMTRLYVFNVISVIFLRKSVIALVNTRGEMEDT